MLRLPPADHPVREFLDVAHVAEVAHPSNRARLSTFREAMMSAQRYIAGSDGAVRAVNSICLRADGSLDLVRFGPRGGHKRLWSFGPIAR